MVSRNQVSVKKPKSGFTFNITDRTSSILGANDCVFACKMFVPNSCSSRRGRQFITEILDGLRPRGAVLEVRWRFCDPIAVTGWLFIEPMGKVSSWIFNWDGGGICKTRLSGKFPTVGEQNVDSREGVAQKLLVRCRKVVEVVVHDLLRPPRVPRRVGFTLEMPKWINRRHTPGSSLKRAVGNEIDCKVCLE